ncbi:MAG: mechanosensitive ion channel family protein, partial [Alphaproteobacteria bacterium]|nr:mechanosensitive ion channel family protein [Alphaproteobacteria bacterium]
MLRLPPAQAQPPAQVQELLRLLEDPGVQSWMREQRTRSAEAQPQASEVAKELELGRGFVAERIAQARRHVAGVLDASEDLPAERDRLAARVGPELRGLGALLTLALFVAFLGAGWGLEWIFWRASRGLAGVLDASEDLPAERDRLAARVGPELRGLGALLTLALFVAFLGAGWGLEWIFWRASRGLRKHIIASSAETTAERVRIVGMRFAFGLAWVAAFAAGSIGSFLVFPWPPLLREIVLTYLQVFLVAFGLAWVAAFAAGSIGSFLVFPWPPLLREIVLTYLQVFLVVRLVLVLGRFVLAPGAPRFRLVPMGDAAAAYWHAWIAAIVGWFAFARLTIALMASLGVGQRVMGATIALMALAWLLLALVAILRRPPRHEGGDAPSLTLSIALASYLALLWLCLLGGAITLFWVGFIALCTPLALRFVRDAVAGLLHSDAAARRDGPCSLLELCLERGLRAIVILFAIWWMASVLGIDLASIAARETVATRLMAGALKAGIILLAADFLWHLLKVVIDGRIAAAASGPQLDEDEQRKRARVRTLLPILRNILAIVLAAMTAMMALSQLGVEIGPLIAGAGVIGVAIGFGAQTLVRDVISGIFYLIDDAFRVGEYIQSGNYKGTVESFSLRSVKLRHHRGPLYTVPFGSLGAIQNMSRDWVIDKTTISVTYDSDLELAKKLIKQVGRDLAADPEFK